MKLKEYLEANLMTANQFASQIQMHRTTIHGYLAGRTPSMEFAYKIEKFTNGAVKAKEMMQEND